MRLIRNVAAKVRVRGGDSASAPIVDEVLDELRRLYEIGLNKEHIELLERIAADPQHELPGDPLVIELLQQDRLLPFSNGSEWFFPHPLLTLNKVTRWKSP